MAAVGRALGIVLGLGLGLGLAACGEGGPGGSPAPTGAVGGTTPRAGKPAGAAEVVARVGEVEIWDVDVARHAGAHGLTPRAAVDELIALELLAAEASRRGLAADPEVVDVGAREAVRRLVDGYATRTATPQSIPAEDVGVVWKRNDVQLRLNHGEIRRLHFLRVHVRRGTPEDEVVRLRGIADQVHAAVIAARPATKDAFQAAGLAAAERAGIKLQGGPFSTMPDDNAAPRFREAAFKIPAVGGISPVTRTPWGWDILYLEGTTPAKVTTFAEAADDLRRKMWPDWRRVTFQRWVDGLAGERSIRTDPAPLEHLARLPESP